MKTEQKWVSGLVEYKTVSWHVQGRYVHVPFEAPMVTCLATSSPAMLERRSVSWVLLEHQRLMNISGTKCKDVGSHAGRCKEGCHLSTSHQLPLRAQIEAQMITCFATASPAMSAHRTLGRVSRTSPWITSRRRASSFPAALPAVGGCPVLLLAPVLLLLDITACSNTNDIFMFLK